MHTMKKLHFGTLVFLMTGYAVAAPSAIITKHSGGGFMMPDHAGFERCEVFADKVVITHQYGMQSPTALALVEERKVSLTGDYYLVIEEAKKEPVTEKENMLCDGPSSDIRAGGEADGVLLFTTGGCGSPRKERQGVNANKLRGIVDIYCPKTFDF